MINEKEMQARMEVAKRQAYQEVWLVIGDRYNRLYSGNESVEKIRELKELEEKLAEVSYPKSP